MTPIASRAQDECFLAVVKDRARTGPMSSAETPTTPPEPSEPDDAPVEPVAPELPEEAPELPEEAPTLPEEEPSQPTEPAHSRGGATYGSIVAAVLVIQNETSVEVLRSHCGPVPRPSGRPISLP
jgi:hypothetical protein